MHAAAWKGHSDCSQLLLEAGAQVNVKNKDGKTPYDLAHDPVTAALLKQASKLHDKQTNVC